MLSAHDIKHCFAIAKRNMDTGKNKPNLTSSSFIMSLLKHQMMSACKWWGGEGFSMEINSFIQTVYLVSVTTQ